MSKYISLGTMSGTSMDGIDLSIINSDGETNTSIIDNFFFEYSSDFKKELINIRKDRNNRVYGYQESRFNDGSDASNAGGNGHRLAWRPYQC